MAADSLSALYSAAQQRSYGSGGTRGLLRHLLALFTHVMVAATVLNTTLKSSDGGTVTAAALQINQTSGDLMVAGIPGRAAALTNQSIVGTGAWTKSKKLDGTAAVVLSADDKDYKVALVWANLNGVPTQYAVFGAEAATGAAVAPTALECRAALKAAAISGLDTNVILITGRITYARAGGNVAATHVDPASDAALAAERSKGTIGAD